MFFLTLYYLPLTFLLSLLFVRLFYTCGFELWYIISALAVFMAWYVAKTFKTPSKFFKITISISIVVSLTILLLLILMSLNTSSSRNSGTIASVKQTVSNMRSYAEMHYNKNNSSYKSVCSDEKIDSLKNGIIYSNDNYELGNCRGPILKMFFHKKDNLNSDLKRVVCNANDLEYAIQVKLPLIPKKSIFDTQLTKYWCVDSQGFAGDTRIQLENSTKCVIE